MTATCGRADTHDTGVTGTAGRRQRAPLLAGIGVP